MNTHSYFTEIVCWIQTSFFIYKLDIQYAIKANSLRRIPVIYSCCPGTNNERFFWNFIEFCLPSLKLIVLTRKNIFSHRFVFTTQQQQQQQIILWGSVVLFCGCQFLFWCVGERIIVARWTEWGHYGSCTSRWFSANC